MTRGPDTDPSLSATGDPAYGRHPVGLMPAHAEVARPAVRPVQVQTFPMSFSGTAGEFFRIWIVNVALSVVTLGLYTPWARVRTRQYFYGNTWVDGHNFEYTANPVALLRGYLIVAVFFAGYSIPAQINTDYLWISVVIGLLFAVLYPWLVRQSLRFLARSTVHRGLNFRFLGSLGDAYVSYGLANLAAGLVFPALPWAWFRQRTYQVRGLRYGQAQGHFRGDVGPFYLIGLTGFGLTVLGVLLLVVLGVMTASILPSFDLEHFDRLAPGLIAALVSVYLLGILVYLGAWQYVRAATMKYVLNNVELGGVVRLSATFSPWQVVWIHLTNTLAQVFTLGLLTPWAAVRRMNYIAPHIAVRTITDLDSFTADAGQDESALGEAATELLDINLGF